jgi:hypothetical protein
VYLGMSLLTLKFLTIERMRRYSRGSIKAALSTPC